MNLRIAKKVYRGYKLRHGRYTVGKWEAAVRRLMRAGALTYSSWRPVFVVPRESWVPPPEGTTI